MPMGAFAGPPSGPPGADPSFRGGPPAHPPHSTVGRFDPRGDRDLRDREGGRGDRDLRMPPSMDQDLRGPPPAAAAGGLFIKLSFFHKVSRGYRCKMKIQTSLMFTYQFIITM